MKIPLAGLMMAKKKQPTKKPQIPGSEDAYVSPFSTGGGGGHFELKVAVFYLAGLLTGEVRRGAVDATVQTVRLQQRNRGYQVDDVICDVTSGVQDATISLQIKHGIRFTENNDAFKEAIGQCWRQFNDGNFDENHDRIGLGFDEGSNIQKIRTHFQELLTWAKTSESSKAFFEKLDGFKIKSQYVDGIRKIVTEIAKKTPADDKLWRFLKCFQAIPFDFDADNSRDQANIIQSLRPLVADETPLGASKLADQLYAIAAEYAKNGGELTLDALLKRLGMEVAARIPAERKSQATALRVHLQDQIQKELDKQINAGKFIPDLFTETSHSKDCARNVLDPVFYFEKSLLEIKHLNLTHFNRMRIDYKLQPVQIPSGVTAPKQLVDVERSCNEVLSALDEFSATIKKSPRDASELSDHERYVLRKRWYTTGEWYISNCVETIRRQIQALKCSVLLILSDAGRGKTNYVCDLAQLLLKLKIPGAFFTGKSLEIARLDDLEWWMLHQMVPKASSTSEAYQMINHLCKETNQPCIILIDAINEHSNLQAFANALEHCIGQMTSQAPIRFVITCREEFFEARFGDFSNAAFGKTMVRIDRLNERMNQGHARRMVESYFRAFHLQVSMSGLCWQELERNPLLLRIFCETYGNPDSSEPIPMAYVESIYKDRLFQEYLDRKLTAVAARANQQNNTLIHSKAEYLKALFALIKLMVSKDNFSSVALAELEPNDRQAVGELLYEELLLRKDLKQELDMVEQEVLVIPFDELRDFLIAKYLVEVVLKKDEQDFQNQTRTLLTAQNTITEGVARCLFFVARRNGHHDLYDLVRNEKWFQNTFLESIFAIEDELIVPEDLEEVRRRFQAEPSQRVEIVARLIPRGNERNFPNLNITLLFELFREMDDAERQKLTQDLFGHDEEYGYGKADLYRISKLAQEILDAREHLEHATITNLIQLLLHLIDVTEYRYQYPAKDAIVKLFESDFDLASNELVKFIKQSPDTNTHLIVETVADIAVKLRKIPKEFHEFAMTKWNGICTPSTASSLLQYFEACEKIDASLVPEDATVQIAKNREEMKKYLERS